ncbi:MAG: sulfatase-like hydrolase/transferase [Methylococcaceae bacterium]|nr:sulfatase-like hydrolase/transferase [Methylococcaceae bacterium]
MLLSDLVTIVRRYRRLIVVLITVIVLQIFELVLLHFKYDIFTGGFLQPYAYRTFSEKLLFISLSFWFDLSLVGLLAASWFFIADKLNKYGLIVYYNFIVVVLLITGIWLALEFKVLSYFSDAINLQIISNLGAGNVKEALIYASNEIALFIGIIMIVAICCFIIVKLIKHNVFICQLFENNEEHGSYRGLLLLVIVTLPLITIFISNHNFLRYGLEKKTSYRLISSILDKVSDIDRDGYGIFSYPKDTVPFNADSFPGALDIPDNGKDEDGFLGDATALNTTADSFSDIEPMAGKHIILIVLETARADLLDHKEDGQYVAPVMREIARNGTSIKYAYSHTGYTVTSINAIFNRVLASDRKKMPLLQFLQSAGYRLSIISGQDESFGNVAETTGMKGKGNYYFDARTAIDDRVFPSTESGSLRLSEERVVQQFKTRFNQLDFSKPQFFYLNFQAAHFPYSHPRMAKRTLKKLIPRSEINLENINWLSASYWNAIANADWAVGQVIESLQQKKLLDQTTIVILGDHGESLFDDKFLGHGHALNDTQTKIPLIINDPNIVVDEPMGQVDVAELTIRSALGLKNTWSNKNKQVFQFVGTLSHPTLIANVTANGIRTLFDFRSEEVFFSDLKVWRSYKEALADPLYKDRITSLIQAWEALRWQEYDSKKQVKGTS